ncbi:cobalt-precorrin-6A reductase [Nakamurella antarctica]|uniref:Cobalt-precorrin-6A reductase n=1 Tax=Nakamurella antarctica TaxID=1902245 RepID=A0A3G8ZP05_9ACTN|nr:cobalt-precorrin-6A reductase [Nakamurella antarctica]AZI58993.1 cobalt-precorrin-6A reductase [Nakamurella antarctica]
MILILGGSSEARALALALTAKSVPIISSLAGRIKDPALPAGKVRIGGFGGVDGLTKYLRENAIQAVINATHPFAATISASAEAACAKNSVPLLRLLRPGWDSLPGAASWHWVLDTQEAGAVAAELSDRVFLTTGRQTAHEYIPALGSRFTAVRVVQAPSEPLPETWEVITSRGPYSLGSEREFMSSRRVGALVTKDSGGTYTSAKLTAATELGIDIVIIRRPEPGQARRVESVDGAVSWVTALSALPH